MLRSVDLNLNEDSDVSTAQLPCEPSLNQLRGLENLKLSKWYPNGSVLFREGQQPYGIFILREGRVKISITSVEGKTLVLGIAESGELLGLSAVLGKRPYDATVETLSRCRIDFVSRKDLMLLLERDCQACLSVAQALGRKLSGVIDHARLLLLSHSAAEKLARLLIRWSDDVGKRTPHGTRIESSLTHEEIAQTISTSRETVSRLLGEFRRQHMIVMASDAIFIRDRKGLEAVARL